MKLIVDSGSTKADWVAISEQEKRVDLVTDGINSLTQSPESMHLAMSSNIELVQIAPKVNAVYFYGAGCSKGEAKEVITLVLQSLFTNATVIVDTDLMACALATYSGKPIISCILGTGSNACHFDGNVIDQKIPALGYVMGDEGGGANFGKQLLSAYFYGNLPEDLKQEFDLKYNLSIQEVLANVYREPSPNRYLASFTEFIGEHKEHPFVNEIIESGFRSFLKTFVLCYGFSKEVSINFVGSVAFYFQEELKKVALELELKIGVVIQKPIEGLVKYHLR
jgi:N-acetylglucosamine kinase-like BadF-type ATPase